VGLVRVPFCCINSWLISYRHRYCTYLYYYNHHHFRLAGIRDLIIDESLRHEFHGSCVDPMRIGEASHAEANDALDAVVKAKLDNYQHDYNERNFCESVLVLVVRGQQFRYDRISRVEPCMADSQGVSAAGVALELQACYRSFFQGLTVAV